MLISGLGDAKDGKARGGELVDLKGVGLNEWYCTGEVLISGLGDAKDGKARGGEQSDLTPLEAEGPGQIFFAR